MNIRRISIAFLIAAVAACQDKSGADHTIGPPPGPDARVILDAPKVFHDAPPAPDAFIPPDAPTTYTRTCTNKNPVVFQGTENLTIAFVCASSADAGAVQVTLKGGSGSGAETRVVPMTLVCAPNGMAANNFLTFAATQQLLATPERSSTSTVRRLRAPLRERAQQTEPFGALGQPVGNNSESAA
jgi:hypothetical protein